MQLLFVKDILSEIFLGIIMVLDTFVYGLIGSAYRIFMAIASARLLSSDVYYDIASRIYVIIGVLMLFVLSYAILKAIVDPDQATKGDLGPGMIKRVIIAVIGLAITPALFNVLYQAQGLFLEQDVLGKIFFRMENTEDVVVVVGDENISDNPNKQIKNIGGDVAASSIWYAFFHPAEGYSADKIIVEPEEMLAGVVTSWVLCGLGVIGAIALSIASYGTAAFLVGGASVALCAGAAKKNDAYSDVQEITDEAISLDKAYAISSGGGGFNIFLVFMDKYLDGEIEYIWGVSTICGAFALYAFASFSIDMGVRAAKLAYYQIIAPIPLIMQVLPKYKENFGKYIGSVVSTFLEVFIRISVVYIVVYVVCNLQSLFSSFGSLWGSESLNLAEKALALAFLIIGLIIFAKSAPDLICESLKLNKGSMKLGIGKKLADGGAFAIGGSAGAGYTAMRRNWRSKMDAARQKAEKEKRLPGFGDYAGAALSAIAGGASATARATYNQIGPGPDKKPAQTFRDAANVAERAAQAATDARDERAEYDEKRKAARAAYETATENLEKERERLVAQGISGNELEEQLKPLRDAQKAAWEALVTAAVANAMPVIKLDELKNKREAWVVGTVSTANEEAAMKFGSALDSLKGDLRAEAYKKDDAARRLNTAYNNLKNEPLREYVEGWDEQSANKLYRDRQALLSSDPSYQTTLNDLQSKRSRLDDLKARGITSGAQYDLAKAELDSSIGGMRTLLQGKGITESAAKSIVSDDGNFGLISDVKIDTTEARKTRDAELEGLRMAMEAAADDFVRRKATDVESNTYRDIAKFLGEHASYINSHKDVEIAVDAEGKKKKVKLGDVITEAFGGDALQGKLNADSIEVRYSQAKVNVDLDERSKVVVNGSSYSKVTYVLDNETDKYVPHVINSDGSVGQEIVGDARFEPVAKESFFDVIAEKIASKKIKKASADTAVTKAGDIGKASATYVRNNDYAEKVSRKRQAEDAKGGGKK